MRHFHFIVSDLKKAKKLIHSFKKMGIPLKDIKLLSENKDHPAISQLLDASLYETTDLIPSLLRGALIGGITGLIITQFYSDYFIVDSRRMLGFTLLGMLFGAWASSLIGVSVTNPALKSLETALDKGKIIIQVTVIEQKEQHLLRFIKLKHLDNLTHITST